VSDDGDDWDELERKAAKCTCGSCVVWAWVDTDGVRVCVAADSKRADAGKARGDSDDSDDDRPKKKKGAAAAKGTKGKANGKR